MSQFTDTFTTCVVSTAHLPEELAEYMEDRAPDSSPPHYIDPSRWGNMIYDKLSYGYRVWTGTDIDDIPNKIRPIIRAAKNQGFNFVEFDQDADEIDGFKTWDW